MKQLSALLRQLRQQLEQHFPSEHGFQQIQLHFPGSQADTLLEWLAAQTVFPQFYWLHREDQHQAIVCGALKQFSHPDQAQAFIRSHPTARIWGLNAFDGDALLLLPRLEIVVRQGKGELTLNLFSEAAKQDDAKAAVIWLDTLVEAKPITGLQVKVRSVQHLPERAEWNTMLQNALKAIQQQQVEKVVLARRSLLLLDSPLFAPALMAASRQVNHQCYHFMLRIDAHSAFLGSSPERLYRREGHHLFTEALAGTVANPLDDQQAEQLARWLLQDKKNQQENRLVVDDICQRLRTGADALQIDPPEIVRLRNVQHLRRSITGQLHTDDDADCLQRLQPTAAIAGSPRQSARHFIQQHEPFCRQWYAGSAGYLAKTEAEFCVSLRSSQIDGAQVYLYAGAGIVADSDPAEEWQELENKAAGLRSLLQPRGLDGI